MPRILVQLLTYLLALLSLSRCILTPGEPTEAPPVPIAGPNLKVRASFASNAKCEPERLGATEWKLRCFTVTKIAGRDFIAVEKPEDLKLEWQIPPTAIAGSAFASTPSCTVHQNGLSMDCDVELEQGNIETTVLTELDLTFL